MRVRKRHIAAFLAGILMSPFLLQPMHVLHHHDLHATGHVCGTDHEIPVTDPSAGISSEDPEDDHCYACDFELPVNDFPVISGPEYISVRVTELATTISIVFNSDEGYNQVSPRGPPSLA